MNYTMIDMLAEDTNAPEIGNPMIWNGGKSVRKRIARAAVKAAAAVPAVFCLLSALFTR